MFGRTRKHVEIWLHRHGVNVYQDGRYVHIDARLSMRSQRDRATLKEVLRVIEGRLHKIEHPLSGPYTSQTDEPEPGEEVSTQPGVAGIDP